MVADRRGSFWVLERRQAFREVENAEKTWHDFINRFPELETIHSDVKNIGAELGRRSQYYDNLVNSGANTMIHGDAKGWNFFFSRDISDTSITPFLFIDMQ